MDVHGKEGPPLTDVSRCGGRFAVTHLLPGLAYEHHGTLAGCAHQSGEQPVAPDKAVPLAHGMLELAATSTCTAAEVSAPPVCSWSFVTLPPASPPHQKATLVQKIIMPPGEVMDDDPLSTYH